MSQEIHNVDSVDNVATNLASKLDVIANNFNIAESTLSELTKQVENNRPIRPVESNELVECELEDGNKLLFRMDDLESDFNTIRKGVTSNLTNAQNMSDTISLMITTEGDIDSEALMAYSQLINTINQSMKLLITTYQDLIKIQESVKKFNSSTPEGPKQQTVHNNFIAVNTAEILSQKHR